MEHGKLKSFLYEKVAEISIRFGIFPEMDGELIPSGNAPVRLQFGFRELTAGPATDAEQYFSGTVQIVILYEPGNHFLAGNIADAISELFSPGRGELRNEQFRVLTTAISIPEHRRDARYEQNRIMIHVVVWENHEY